MQKNKKYNFSPELAALLEALLRQGHVARSDATRVNNNISVKVDAERKLKQANKRIANEHTARHFAKKEADRDREAKRAALESLNKLNSLLGIPLQNIEYGPQATNQGTIQDGWQAKIDKAYSDYGMSNALGQMTNVSDAWRATPSFGRFMGKDAPMSMVMAGQAVANPIGFAGAMGAGYLGSELGAKVGEHYGNKELGRTIGSLATMPFGYKAATSNATKNFILSRAINQATKNGVKETAPSRYITKDYNFNDDGTVSSIMYQLHDPLTGKHLGNGVISSPVFGMTKGRPVGWIESQNGAKGVSEDIYNVAVKDAKTYGDLGVESGWDLMEPRKTLAVTKKFPHKVIGESQGHPVRLLTGTTGKQLPWSINQSNHHIDVTNNTIRYNLETGLFEEIKPSIGENVYNHPGAFINLEETFTPVTRQFVHPSEAVRKAYTAPNLERLEMTTAEPLMNGSKGAIRYESKPITVSSGFKPYTNVLEVIPVDFDPNLVIATRFGTTLGDIHKFWTLYGNLSEDELIAKGILRSSLVNGQRKNAVILDGKLKGPFELFTQRKPEVLGKDISGLYGSVEAPSNEGNLFFRPTLLEDSNALFRTGEIDRPITYLNIINDPKKLSLIRKAADNGTMLTTPEGIPIVSSVNEGQSVSAGAYAAAIENADKGPFWVVTKGILPHVNDPYVERFYDFFTNSDWNATQYGYFGRRRELISWLKNRGFDENSLQYKNAMERFDVIEALNRAKKVKEWAYPNFAEGTAQHPHRRLGDLVNFSKEHLIKKKGNDINWTDTEKEDYMRSVFGLSLFGGGDLTQGGVKEFLIPRGNYVDIRTNKVVPFDNFGNEIPYYIDFTKTYPKEGTLINYTNFEGKYMPINGMYDLETAAAYKGFPMFRMLRVGDPVPSSSFGLPLRTAIPLKRKGGVVKRN